MIKLHLLSWRASCNLGWLLKPWMLQWNFWLIELGISHDIANQPSILSPSFFQWTWTCPCLRKDAAHLPPTLYPAEGISACADKRRIHRWRLAFHLMSSWFSLTHDLIITLRMGANLIGDSLLSLIAASLHTLDNHLSVYFCIYPHICTQGIHITIPSQLL